MSNCRINEPSTACTEHGRHISNCSNIHAEERDKLLLQVEELKRFNVAEMARHDNKLAELTLKNGRLQDALSKIHDLAGQMGDIHPHVGAIQAWVHEVSPCSGNRSVPAPKSTPYDTSGSRGEPETPA